VVKTIGEKTRFANEELLLRFFAFNDNLNSYTGKLSTFLNSYMHTNRHLTDADSDIKEELVIRTFTLIHNKIFDNRAIKGIGKTVLEGLLFGVSQNLMHLEQKPAGEIKALFDDFLKLDQFSLTNLKEGLAQKDKLSERLIASKNVFSK